MNLLCATAIGRVWYFDASEVPLGPNRDTTDQRLKGIETAET